MASRLFMGTQTSHYKDAVGKQIIAYRKKKGGLIEMPSCCCCINRGYYTVARRYEFYVRVARTRGNLSNDNGDGNENITNLHV